MQWVEVAAVEAVYCTRSYIRQNNVSKAVPRLSSGNVAALVSAVAGPARGASQVEVTIEAGLLWCRLSQYIKYASRLGD